MEFTRLISQLNDFLSQINRTFAAFSPGISQNNVDA